MDKEARQRELLERYNRKAVETGSRLQGEFFLRIVHEFDELDPEWTQVWLTWVYDHMYNRGVLHDKTRVLCVIGECVVTTRQSSSQATSARRCASGQRRARSSRSSSKPTSTPGCRR